MESVSFKIYFESANDGSEIRRFCIDESSAGTFECVKDKIRQLYPSLQNKDFNIFWKDNENDKIAVNCDVEYIVAITTIREEVRDDIVRLYVTLANNDFCDASCTDTSAKEKKAANVIRYTPEELKALNSASCDVNQDDDNSSDGEASGNVEASAGVETKTAVTFSPGTLKGLICDSCDKSLDGKVLFKCVTCPDYDLCASCVKQSHMEHVMIRIPSQQALMRSGIFVVDRLNRLARRRSHTSRFDFSALIVPLADNYKVSHFRKMKDADATTTNCAASSSAANFATVYTTSRKAARKMATAAAKGGALAYPVGVLTSHPVTLRKSASFVGEERKSRGGEGEERKSKGRGGEEGVKEKKEKESRLKRSRSARGGEERRCAGVSANSFLDHFVHPSFLNNFARGRGPADDIIKGVADILAGVNISCPYDQKSAKNTAPASSNQPETKQPEETRKRKVSATSAAADAGAAAMPQPRTVGQLMKDILVDFKCDLVVPQNQATGKKEATDLNGVTAQAKADRKTVTDTQQKTEENKSAAPRMKQTSLDKDKTPTSPPQQLLDDNDGIRVAAMEEEVEVEGASSPDEQGWTFVGPTLTGAIPKQTSVYPSPSEIPQVDLVQPPVGVAPTTTTTTTTVPPTSPGQRSPLTEKQERLSCALNKMLAMGFTNEGGWLENLLDNHDASIERVLEILLPSSVFGRVID